MSNDNSYPLKLGVTGGIGSGKTSVCRVFSVLGIPVFSADLYAKEIMDDDQAIKTKLNNLTGKDLYESGSLDRAGLASLIFSNPGLLREVNSIVHPVVFNTFRTWAKQHTAPYVIMEAAILFESGAYSFVDRVLTVVAPLEERIERVMMRNKLTHEQVYQRIRNQMEDEQRIKLSHYVIRNSENDMIIPAVLEIHKDLLSQFNSKTNG